MGKLALDKKLGELEALRCNAEDAREPLRKALKDRNNFFVGKAAALAGELGLTSLAEDLAAAFDRFLAGAAESDPQCWAKNAIVKTLKDLNYEDASLFLRGARHVQLEPVWGGRADSAATLRGACALALVACSLPRHEILKTLVDLLAADGEKSVRIDAARAIAQLSGPDSVLLLRMKSLAGDREPEVVGQCFFGLLDLAPSEYLPFVGAFLDSPNPDLRLEAAAALAECPNEEAVEILRQSWCKAEDADFRRAILLSLGASRLESAAGFLLSVIPEGRFDDAGNAVRALAAGRFRQDFQARVAEAIARRGDPRLKPYFLTETV